MIIGHNFGYDGFNVKYDTMYSCDESGCDDEGVCRCGQIYNQEIEKRRNQFESEIRSNIKHSLKNILHDIEEKI